MADSASPNPVAADDALGRIALLDSEQRKTVRLCLSVLGALGTASLIGVAFSLYLVNHYALLLIALSPLGRHMVLVAPMVDPIAFVVVAVARRMGFYLPSFHLGRALGPAGIPWVEARAARVGRYMRWLERLFSRASHAIVVLMTGPMVSALAGISGMRARVFFPLATLSLVARMVLVLGFAAWIREYIEIALAWIDEYWIPGTVVMVAGVAIYRWRRRNPLTVMED